MAARSTARARIAGSGARRRRGNPVEDAAALSEAFHGRPARTGREVVEEIHEHSTLADLGKLLRIELTDGAVLKGFGAARLCSNESGTQLFIVGGDQSVPLDQFAVDPSKESVCLGTVKVLDYHTAKQHLGEEDKIPGPYTHQLGEESGVMPLLCYDTINCFLSFVGGSYHIDVDMDGKYSAGIRD